MRRSAIILLRVEECFKQALEEEFTKSGKCLSDILRIGAFNYLAASRGAKFRDALVKQCEDASRFNERRGRKPSKKPKILSTKKKTAVKAAIPPASKKKSTPSKSKEPVVKPVNPSKTSGQPKVFTSRTVNNAVPTVDSAGRA